jgi:hypothetical protein
LVADYRRFQGHGRSEKTRIENPPRSGLFQPLYGGEPDRQNAPGRLAANAVTVEPVSAAKFPANREKNREFCRIRPLSAILKADTRANSEACSEITYATEQGNILEEQGIPAEEPEILPAKTKIGAG